MVCYSYAVSTKIVVIHLREWSMRKKLNAQDMNQPVGHLHE